jgi:hypothetical protein
MNVKPDKKRINTLKGFNEIMVEIFLAMVKY